MGRDNSNTVFAHTTAVIKPPEGLSDHMRQDVYQADNYTGLQKVGNPL